MNRSKVTRNECINQKKEHFTFTVDVIFCCRSYCPCGAFQNGLHVCMGIPTHNSSYGFHISGLCIQGLIIDLYWNVFFFIRRLFINRIHSAYNNVSWQNMQNGFQIFVTMHSWKIISHTILEILSNLYSQTHHQNGKKSCSSTSLQNRYNHIHRIDDRVIFFYYSAMIIIMLTIMDR